MPESFTNVASPSWSSSRMGRAVHWMRRVLGLDRAIGFTILARFWSSLAGLITVIMIARFLSPAEQGYYYTFGSLVALQIVFELGFSFVILQLASHERAHLSISSDYEIQGDTVCHARLASVLQKAVRWYSVAAILMATALIPVGLRFFSVHQQAGSPVSWHLPWCFAVLAATLTFQIDPILSFFEGCGYVSNIAHLRFVQAICGSLMAWTAFLFHHGLFAPGMTIFGNACASLAWLIGKRRLLFHLLRYKTGPHKIVWYKEVWPFQWRIAISWLCAYFIFQLYNPVLFAYQGPIAAGQMGMSLSLATALQAIAVSWINTKAAPFGAMIARKEYKNLDQIFFRTLKQAIVVFLLGSLVTLLLDVYLNFAHVRFAQRLISPLALLFLLVTTAINIIVSAEALYLRAHKQEKFLLNSILGAIFVSLSTFVLGRYYGILGVASGSLLIALTFGIGSGTFVFMKYRRIWHAE